MSDLKQKELANHPQPDPYQSLFMMTDDYLDSRHGRIKTDEQGPHTDEDLSDLRRSIASFAILNDIELSIPAERIHESEEVMMEDLRRDEVLARITDHYKEMASGEGIQSIDIKKVKKVELPSLTGSEVERAFSKLGFVEVRRSGNHLILERENEDGTVTRFPAPTNHAGDVNPRLLREIITIQAKLSLDEFVSVL